MRTELKTLKKDTKYSKIGYGRIVTNHMSIVAWKLYKSNPRLHFAFVIYRLKRDFGFTDWEIANFTGMPVNDVTQFLVSVRPMLKSEVLKILAEIEFTYDEEEKAWRSVKRRGKPQGYYEIKDRPAWYTGTYRAKRWRSKPPITFGDDEKGLLEEIIK